MEYLSMRTRMVIAGIVIGLLIGAVTVTALELRAPGNVSEAGRLFCAFNQSRSEAALKRMMTSDLRRSWIAAQKKNDVIASANPDEKPPFGDGIPTQAYPDDAPICESGKIVMGDGVATIEIRHAFPDQPRAGWTDRLALRQQGPLWLLDDIQFGLSRKDTLRAALDQAFKS